MQCDTPLKLALIYEKPLPGFYYTNRTSTPMDMDFVSESRHQHSNLSFIAKREKKLSNEVFSIAVALELALVVVNDLVFAKRGKYLSETEILIIKGALNDREYEEIATHSTYSLNYIQRTVAPQLWDMLSEIIGNGERVGKKKLCYFLEQVNKKYLIQFSLNKEEKTDANNLVKVSKGKMPDVSKFYGRTKELSYVKELINKHRCISLVGVAGAGKSTLAAKLIAEISVEPRPGFDCLIWKSLTHAPLLQDLIGELIELIPPLEPESSLPEYTQAMISVLIKRLQSRRCLVVLDAFEALFQGNNFAQRLEYGLFFHRLIEEEHQSCLLLTSRILPDDIDIIIRAEQSPEYLKIEGLDADAAMELLFEQGLTDQEKCSELIETYRGNPLELKAVVKRINHFFAGDTKMFFENPTTLISNEFQAMLNEMFGQLLSETQKQIMICLAEEIVLNSKTTSFTKLLNRVNQKLSVSTSEIITAIEKLERQSLIESGKDPLTKEINFSLQPVIRKYIITDPRGLVRGSDHSLKLAIAS